MANVIFMDSFDSYDFTKTNSPSPNFTSKWVGNGGVRGVPGRFGGQAACFGALYSGPNYKTFFTNNTFYQALAIGFALQFNNVPNAPYSGSFFSFLNNADTQISIQVSEIGEILLFRGDTKIATSAPNLVKTQDWHYMEIEYVNSNSAGRVTIFLDGAQVLNFQGNAQNLSTVGVNGIQLAGTNRDNLFYYIDDLFVVDAATRIGERRIETLRPNGDVVGNNFTPNAGTSNFATLNETLVSANEYVTAQNLGKKDLYEFDNLGSTPSKIDAIQLTVWGTKTDADTRQLGTIVKSGTFETIGPNYNLPNNHLNMNRIEQVDPATNAAWTPPAINAIQAGFKITL